jgi:hypothetical protein
MRISIMVEIKLLLEQIEDLQDRLETLRGYL